MAGNKKGATPDFKVIKRKVGKKLKPANATSTSFEAKQVIVREQSVAADSKSESITSSRGLTVDQLTPQTRHHNSKVRREAFQQLKQLLVDKYEASSVVKQEFYANFESLAEGVSDQEADVRKAFLEMLEEAVTRSVMNAQHVSSLLNHVAAAFTSSGVGRRVDATRIVQLLVKCEKYCSNVVQAMPRLLPCFADVCRSVLGTTSSSLAKGVSSSGASLGPQKKGGILSALKKEEEQEKAKNKAKRMKTAAAEALSSEMRAVGDRLLQVATSIYDIAGIQQLDASRLDDRDLDQLLRAVLELHRHTREGASVLMTRAHIVSSKALARLATLVRTNLEIDFCDQLLEEFSHQQVSRYSSGDREDLELASLTCCICCGGRTTGSTIKNPSKDYSKWLCRSYDFFLSCQKAQDETIASGLLRVLDVNVERRESVLGAMFENVLGLLIIKTDDSLGRAASGMQALHSLIETKDFKVSARILEALPASLWQMIFQVSSSDNSEQNKLASALRSLQAGFALLLFIVRIFVTVWDDMDIWLKVSKALSPYWCGFTKHSGGGIVEGPFTTVLPRDLKDDLFAIVAMLPVSTLPQILLKSWAESIRSFDVDTRDIALMVEIASACVLRNSQLESHAEATLSFLVSVALLAEIEPVQALCGSVVKRISSSTNWPIRDLLAPIVRQSVDSAANNHAWLMLAATVQNCGQSSPKDELTMEIAKVMGAMWTASFLSENVEGISSRIYSDLAGIISPELVYEVTPSHDVLRGWITELLLMKDSIADSDDETLQWWLGSRGSSLRMALMEQAKNDDSLASNIRLLHEYL